MTRETPMLVKLKYLKEGTPDKDGKVPLYFRRHGRKIRLKPPFLSAAWWAEYQQCLAGTHPDQIADAKKKPELSGKRVTADSLEALCRRYEESVQFLSLDPDTQARRKAVIKRLCKKYGHLRYADMEKRHVRVLRDNAAKAGTAHTGNALLKTLRQVFALAFDDDLIKINPAAAVPYIAVKSDGYHSWTVDEVRQFLQHHPIGTTAHLACVLLLCTGLRRSDVVRIGKQMVRGGWLHVPDTAKTGATILAELGASEYQLMAIFGWETPKEAARYVRAARRRRLAGQAFALPFWEEIGMESGPNPAPGSSVGQFRPVND